MCALLARMLGWLTTQLRLAPTAKYAAYSYISLSLLQLFHNSRHDKHDCHLTPFSSQAMHDRCLRTVIRSPPKPRLLLVGVSLIFPRLLAKGKHALQLGSQPVIPGRRAKEEERQSDDEADVSTATL